MKLAITLISVCTGAAVALAAHGPAAPSPSAPSAAPPPIPAAAPAVTPAPLGVPFTVPGRAATRRIPGRSRPIAPRGVPALDADLADLLTSKVRTGRWGAIVVSLTRGDTLFQRGADALMQPASTLKLFTTGLAFDRFGPSYQIGTDVLRDTAMQPDGTLPGSLYLRGGGDPSLSTRFLGANSSPMDNLARAIAATGLKRVKGDIVADASAFVDQPIPDGWKRRYLAAAYAAPVSALSLNENVVWVAVSPGARGATVALEPATTAYAIANHVTLRPGSRGGAISVRRLTDTTLDVRGWIGTRASTERYSIVANDPPRFAAGALRASLAALGITVDGELREGVTPASATPVASIESPPLAEIISQMNRESINHVAELLFRDASRVSAPDHIGSVEAGEAALRQFLWTKVGVPGTDVRVADGSGLSVRDSVTPRAMVHLLAYANRAPWSSAFHSSLPVAGESELLKARMRRTPAQGNLHAKTGTTNTVASLAGYVTAEDGEILAFALIYNGGDRWNARAAMDKMGAALAAFSRN